MALGTRRPTNAWRLAAIAYRCEAAAAAVEARFTDTFAEEARLASMAIEAALTATTPDPEPADLGGSR